jgi:hypothetical protein
MNTVYRLWSATRLALRISVILVVMFGMLAAMVQQASAASRLGGVDLNGYCKAKYSTVSLNYSSVATAGLKYNDAGGWRCYQATLMLWPISFKPLKYRQVRHYYEHSIDMNDACRRQYGSGVYAATNNWSNPYSWSCYR